MYRKDIVIHNTSNHAITRKISVVQFSAERWMFKNDILNIQIVIFWQVKMIYYNFYDIAVFLKTNYQRYYTRTFAKWYILPVYDYICFT